MTRKSHTGLYELYKHVHVEISNIPLFPLLGSSQILQQEPVTNLYPKILSTEEIGCNWGNISFDYVYWFRSISNHRKVEFLGQCTIVRPTYAENVDKTRFKFISKSMSFTLRIINVTEEDAGIYSCVLKSRKTNEEIWKPGTLLLPGGLYAEISSASFTVVKYDVKYQAAVRVSVHLSEFRWQARTKYFRGSVQSIPNQSI